ncbi:hypothetical protein VHEMI02717 [[Torrubiella] hemipterigena]|uniref:Uncharacterized protein n=1 Tax=[Torrubiella] hemipterigena TaxID=1531966 RepID=A0A0A1SQJ5_9HYPO|nr:hypothetical protein VHEMI02717 [[Torrubiella] hemipterigena]
MKTSYHLPVLALAYTGAADNISNVTVDPATYNATSSVSISGYNVSSNDTGAHSYWTITSGLVDQPKQVLNVITLQDADLKAGNQDWEVCIGVYWGKRRKDTKPVPKDCTGFLSDKCIEGLKKTGSKGDGAGCSLQTVPAECELTDGVNSHYRGTELAYVTDGRLTLTSSSREKTGNGTAEYDSYVGNVTVVSTYWSYNHTGKPLGDVQLSCMGFDSFKEGSRNATAVLPAASSAPAIKMSLWLVGIAALLVAL